MKKNVFLALLLAAMMVLGVCAACADSVETELFSAELPDGWAYDEDWMTDDDEHCYVSFIMDDEDDSFYSAQVDVTCDVNGAGSFSQKMSTAGLNIKAALTENTYAVRSIGGVDCWIGEKSNSVNYYGYIPEKNGFIMIEVYADEDAEEAVDALLNGFSFSFSDYDGEILPWYWEGTAYTAPECSNLVNGHIVSSRLLPIDAVEPCYTTTEAKMDAAGDAFYIYADKQLKKYLHVGDALVYDSLIELPYEPRTFAVNKDGAVYLSGFGKDLTMVLDGAKVRISGDTDDIAVHPSKTWGVSYFSGNDFMKVDLLNGSVTGFTLPEISYLKQVFVTENCIIIDGQLEDGTACVRIYDQELNLRGQVDQSNNTTGWFGGANAAAETVNGFILFDLNVRSIYFLDTDCSVVRAADFNEILGTRAPWPCSAVTGEDGNVYLMATDARPDGTCSETVVFQLSGY